MAVYTHVSDDEIRGFLSQYDCGELITAKPISEGVENTNYLLLTRKEGQQLHYILTLYEQRVQEEDLPFFMQLKQHLAKCGRNCPLPIQDHKGEILHRLKGRKAAIFSFLLGESARRISNEHLSALGAEMATMHLSTQNLNLSRENALSPDKLRPLYEKCAFHLNEILPHLQTHIAQEIDAFSRWQTLSLPSGIIHADLFPDNVFYIHETLTGVIDFYFACSDYLAYDLAICLNAWCFENNTEFNITKAKRLLQSYSAVRPLSEAELDQLPFLARAAAVRFMLTRAHDWFFPVEGAVVKAKDPLEYVKKWEFHRQVDSYRGYVL